MEIFGNFTRKITGIPRRGAPKGANKVDFADIANLLNDETLDDFTKLENALSKKFTTNLKNNISIGKSKQITIENLYLLYNKTIFLSIESLCCLDIVFKNNTFLCNEKNSNTLFIRLLGYGVIKFNHNDFKNVELHLEKNFNKHFHKLPTPVHEQKKCNELETNISQPNDKRIELENNIISAIKCPANARVNFNKNTIDKLDIFEAEKDGNFSIRWTPNQRIDLEKKHTATNRESFIVLKERAIKKSDKFQETVLNREIIKCESVLFEQENASRQDRFIMLFGELVSKHGVSWLIPLAWLFSINLSLTFIAFWIAREYSTWEYPTSIAEEYSIYWNFVEVFLEMLNPLSNLAETMKPLMVGDNVAISIINVFQKPILAVLIYELIRVMRRFT